MDAPPADQPTATDHSPRPRRSRRPWWLGGGAALAVLVAIMIALVARAPGGPAEPTEPDFTHIPKASCPLISKATADTYAPGTTCQVDLDEKDGDAALIGVNWLPPHVGNEPFSAVLSVTVMIDTGTLADSDADKWLSTGCQEWAGLPGSRSINGIGDRACFVYGTKYGTAANLDVRTRNVVIEVSYGPQSTAPDPAFSEQYGERAVRTAVADVIRQLS